MKYRILKEKSIVVDGRTLYRIKALKDFYGINKGQLGGYVQSENNLSHKGNCWIYHDAKVYDNAYVNHDAKIYDKACIYGNAQIYGNAWISGDNVNIYENARVYQNAKVYDNVRIHGDAQICSDAEIHGNAHIQSSLDYAVFHNSWSSFRYFTYTASNKKWKVGCFYGTGEELIKKAYKDSELSGRCYEAIVRAQETIDKSIEKERNEVKNAIQGTNL